MLEAYGWTLDHVHGSHHVFEQGSGKVVIPMRRPHILPVYVKQILAATEGMDRGDDDDDKA